MAFLRPALLVLLVPSLAAAEAEEMHLSLLVPDVGASGDIDAEAVAPVHELLMTRFQESGIYRVFGTADLLELLEAEQRKQLLGCEDDASCLAQIGGAMGADLIAKASVGKIGDTHLFNLKMLNSETAQAEARCSKEVNGPVDAVLPAVSECIDAVTQELSFRYELRRTDQTGGIGPLPLFITGGVAVAAGIATLGLDLGAGREANALRDDPDDKEAYDSGRRLQTAERMTLGVTVAAAVAAGALAYFTDFGARPTEETSVEVAPAAGSGAAGFVLVGRFW